MRGWTHEVQIGAAVEFGARHYRGIAAPCWPPRGRTGSASRSCCSAPLERRGIAVGALLPSTISSTESGNPQARGSNNAYVRSCSSGRLWPYVQLADPAEGVARNL
jgi:hypothetical protein